MTKNLKKNIIIFTNNYWLSDVVQNCIIKNKNFLTTIVTTQHKLDKSISKKKIEVKFCKNLSLEWCKKNLPKNFEIGFSIGSPWIFDKEVLEYYKNKFFNIHQSPLPRFRGGSLTSLIILKEIRSLQISIHRITEKIDNGEIVFSKDIFISNVLKTPKDINDYIQNFVRKTALDFLDSILIKKKEISPYSQNNYFSYYVPRLNSNINGWIDWSLDVNYIERFIRCFDNPYDGALTTLNSKKVRIKNIEYSLEDNSTHPYENGMILRKFMDFVVVSVLNGSIYIRDVIDEKGKKITKFSSGDKLFTPMKYLDLSKERVLYNNKSKLVYTNFYKLKK